MKYCLLLLLASAVHAAPLHVYAHLGVAADLHPQRYESVWRNSDNPYLYHTGPRKLFVPGAMDAVSLGIAKGPLFMEVSHLSAIEDGFNGAGITWLSTGLRFDLWRGQ